MPRRLGRLIIAIPLALACAGGGAQDSTISPPLESPSDAAAWEFQNPTSWKVADGILQLEVPGQPGGPIRKPAEWAILQSDPWEDVIVEAEVRADAPVTRMGRDVLIFFGYQSPTRFYYAHLSNETTPPHNGIFLVNDADRLRIDDGSAEPRLMDADWHQVRLERDSQTGSIRVFLGDMQTPVLEAVDTTLRSGRIGFGSFDDPAAFRNIRVQPLR